MPTLILNTNAKVRHRGVRAVSHWHISCSRIDDLSEYSLWCVHEHLHACMSAARYYRVKVSAGRDGRFLWLLTKLFHKQVVCVCVCVRFALRSIQHIVVHTVKCHRTTFRRQYNANSAKQMEKKYHGHNCRPTTSFENSKNISTFLPLVSHKWEIVEKALLDKPFASIKPKKSPAQLSTKQHKVN